jgi:hypothetical protein
MKWDDDDDLLEEAVCAEEAYEVWIQREFLVY